MRVIRNVIYLCLVFSFALTTRAAETLTLDGFLKQVRTGNQAVVGGREASQAAAVIAKEGDVLLSPTLYGNVQIAVDKSPKINPIFQGDRTDQQIYTLGVSQLTTFGLQAKLYYNFSYISISGVDPMLVPQNSLYDGKTALEFTQSLWRNGFGSEVNLQREALEAKALSDQHAENYRVKLLEAEAESTYWRLALARSAAAVAKDSLGRAVKVRDWNARRVDLRLTDESDLLQSEAGLKLRTLELQSTTDEERAAGTAFNAARGIAGAQVAENLTSVVHAEIEKMKPPAKLERREDVEAAFQGNRALAAASRLAIEKNRPNLEVYSALSLNGRAPSVGGTISDSFNANKPMAAVGVRFSLPLDFGLVSDTDEARRLEAHASELKYQRKIFEQEKEWTDFNLKYAEALKRLDIVRQIEEVQKEKFTNEKDRQSRGRSTTFLVLQFEQDLASSQFSRLRAEADVLILLAQMKTFGGVL